MKQERASRGGPRWGALVLLGSAALILGVMAVDRSGYAIPESVFWGVVQAAGMFVGFPTGVVLCAREMGLLRNLRNPELQIVTAGLCLAGAIGGISALFIANVMWGAVLGW